MMTCNSSVGKSKDEKLNRDDENGSAGGDQSGLAGVGGGVARARAGRRRTGPPPPHNGAHEPHQNNNNNNNNNNTLHPTIKNERLSPHAATDRSSSRSRSVTPSTGSFPGTPPQTGTGTGSGDRGSSPAHPHTALLGPHAPPPPQHQALARNYSDFMRSLAAKYNNPNSNEFYAGVRPMAANGFPPNMDPRFALKAPYVGLLAPPAAGAPPTIRTSPPPPAPEIRDRPVGGIFAGYSYAQGGPRNVPAFPSIMDMSSTKALLAIARAANMAKEVELASNFMKGATKRPPGAMSNDVHPLSSPLDLSSAAGAGMYSSLAKKSRLSPKHETSSQNESGSSSGSVSYGEPGDISPTLDCKPNLAGSTKSDGTNGSCTPTPQKSQRLSVGRARSEVTSPASFGRKSPASSGRKSPSNRDCGSCCRDGRRECNQGPDLEVATWTVDDVCKFVESIDICAEYSPMFREQRIDGSGLPLLTEDHLTGLLRMKLGPALKMKATLAGRLGGCHHCRCRSTPTLTSASRTSPSPEAPSTASGSLVKVERPPSAESDNS
ncbi:uncharacterized protein LOC143916081 isoform X2 [Arctopsyche grandis]|uniref:uncharacterized protein LOC143916081 isoform X2 n=1 Tax=Arctopsyche grandis TaxID=121162 RepID=UPI00406DA00E